MPQFTRQETAMAHRVRELLARIGPLLGGQPEPVQSAVIADLLATFLAGHIVKGEPEATAIWRQKLLSQHLDLVHKLVPVNHDAIHGKDG